jgi:hypothetical protein
MTAAQAITMPAASAAPAPAMCTMAGNPFHRGAIA